MRGKVGGRIWLIVYVRITPAHAGKRYTSKWENGFSRDHPRTCGEKKMDIFCYNFKQGSPPHMRGKVTKKELADLIRRITPAHAGKSLLLRNF